MILFLFTLLASVPSFAGSISDESIRNIIDQAAKLYSERSSIHLESVDQALELLKEVEGKASDSNLNYDILIAESKAYLWESRFKTSSSEQLKASNLGKTKGDQAISLNSSYAEGYYYAGANLGRNCEITYSVSSRHSLINYFNSALKGQTRDHKPGALLDGYGPDRALGRIYYKLPALFGGSYKEAMKHLSVAFDNAKDFAINVVFYTEALSEGSSNDKIKAREYLDFLLSQDPYHYNLDRVPDTLIEFDMARKLRSEL